MMTLGVLLVLWVVLGLVAGLVCNTWCPGVDAEGQTRNYTIGVLIAVVLGVVEWFVLGWVTLDLGVWKLVILVVDPWVTAVIVLWALQMIRQRGR